MSFRGPKGVKLYHNGELCAEMESVNATIDLLVLHDPKHRCWDTVRRLYYEARRNNTKLFGFKFVEDPNWIPSRAVMATDVETNEAFVKDSVGEMSRAIFGPNYDGAASYITKLCKNGKSYRGLIFNYVNEDDGFKIGHGSAGDGNRKTVQQLNIDTCAVISEYPSIGHAAQHIWDIGLSVASSVTIIKTSLSASIIGAHSISGKYLGYRWRFKP